MTVFEVLFSSNRFQRQNLGLPANINLLVKIRFNTIAYFFIKKVIARSFQKSTLQLLIIRTFKI